MMMKMVMIMIIIMIMTLIFFIYSVNNLFFHENFLENNTSSNSRYNKNKKTNNEH